MSNYFLKNQVTKQYKGLLLHSLKDALGDILSYPNHHMKSGPKNLNGL